MKKDSKQNPHKTLIEELQEQQNPWDYSDIVMYKGELIQWVNEKVVKQISKSNNEPKWMLELRLNALELFNKTKMPDWWPNLDKLDLDSIYYFAKPVWAGDNKTWEDVPENIKKTFDRLGIPEAEKKALSGVGAQYDSEVVYHNLKQELKDKWVIFDDMSSALQNPKYKEIIKKFLFFLLEIKYKHRIIDIIVIIIVAK